MATTTSNARLLTPAAVAEMVPGMTINNLAQLRFKGQGPKYLKPTPRVVIYREVDVFEWLNASVRVTTAAAA